MLAWKRGLMVNKRMAHAQAALEYWLLTVTYSWASSGDRGWAREPRADAHFCKNVYNSTLCNLVSPPSAFAHHFLHYVETSAITSSYSDLSVAVNVFIFIGCEYEYMCDVVLHVVYRVFIDPGFCKCMVSLCKRYALFFDSCVSTV